MSVAPVVCSARARRTVLSRPCTSSTPGAPRRRLDARALSPAPRPALPVCAQPRPRGVRRPRGAPSPGAACGGGRQTAPPRRAA
eukprot:7313233-Prymnesium_polylepis.1